MGKITLPVNGVTDLFTIIGVIFAIVVYFLWKYDYRLQKAHEYALSLLKKFKYLHVEIESMRSPKFYHKETVAEDIEKNYIPTIEEKIRKKIVEIMVDLLIAEKNLVKHKNLQSKFNESIVKNIISPINIAVYEFLYKKNQPDFKLNDTKLWEIIFPAEVMKNKCNIKRSVLGTNMEVIDDDFNNIIETNFNAIYSDLEDNLAIKISSKKKKN